MEINKDFIDWASIHSGCDGGNLKGKIWLCGIEWGGGQNPNTLNFKEEFLKLKNSIPFRTHEDTQRILKNENRKNTYDLNAFKLLSVIETKKELLSINYKEIIKEIIPFEKNSNYFKLNLYPISFKITSDSLWDSSWKTKTGLENKNLYKLWCWKNRFPYFQKLVNDYNPELIICVGKLYLTDFLMAFEGLSAIDFSHNMNVDRICDDNLFWLKINTGKTILCITPFLTNAGNLVGNDKISEFGLRISRLMK
ncbi:MAG: hypothetical protein MH321_06125 [Leptospiraceae bacterium]|nr:hypothetical protein [Leptospiraceae bacterium]